MSLIRIRMAGTYQPESPISRTKAGWPRPALSMVCVAPSEGESQSAPNKLWLIACSLWTDFCLTSPLRSH